MHKIAKLLTVFTLTALVALGFTACDRSDPAKEDTIAATVNGKPILVSEVEQALTEQTGGKQSQMTQLELAEARLGALDGLIRNEVLYQRAEKEKLLPSEDEISQYITAKKQERGMTEEEFQKGLKEQNKSEQNLREDARKLLAIQKLQNKYIASVSISDREVEEYYAANKQQFVIPRGVELAAIVVDPADNGARDDAKSDAEAKAKIDKIYEGLKNADFAEVARQKSEDASAAQGGDIGLGTEDALKQKGFPQSVVDQFFGPAMQIGSYTQPVQFSGRWYIFKLKGKHLQTENRTLETPGLRQQLTEDLRGKRQQLLNTALLEQSMYEAKIVNNMAAKMLANPNNLGLRPASSQAVGSPAPSPAASTTPGATPAKSASTASPKTSPAKK